LSNSDSPQPQEEASTPAQQAAREETASAWRRRQRTDSFRIALLGAIIAFGMLTVLVRTAPSLDSDVFLTRLLQSITWPFFAAGMQVVSWPGFPPQSIIFTALIGLLIYSFGLKWEAVSTLIAAVLSSGIDEFVKLLVRRPRPAADLVDVFASLNSYSFPSGHVMFYLTFFGFLWFLAFTLLKPSVKRTILLVLFGLPVLLVGISRIYLGQHWASDVLGAYLLGSLCLVVIIELYRWGKTRFFVHQPVAPEKPKAHTTKG
jgi:undecaprenyl-diphosphatase